LALLRALGNGDGRLTLQAAAGAACQLPGCIGGAPDDGGDLVKRHGKHVVQYEREPFRRSQPVKHNE
jgi:hypothetical protein